MMLSHDPLPQSRTSCHPVPVPFRKGLCIRPTHPVPTKNIKGMILVLRAGRKLYAHQEVLQVSLQFLVRRPQILCMRFQCAADFFIYMPHLFISGSAKADAPIMGSIHRRSLVFVRKENRSKCGDA